MEITIRLTGKETNIKTRGNRPSCRFPRPDCQRIESLRPRLSRPDIIAQKNRSQALLRLFSHASADNVSKGYLPLPKKTSQVGYRGGDRHSVSNTPQEGVTRRPLQPPGEGGIEDISNNDSTAFYLLIQRVEKINEYCYINSVAAFSCSVRKLVASQLKLNSMYSIE